MSIPYHRWPDDLAARYREKGYWLDVPMTDILARHKESDAIAVIEGDLQLSYGLHDASPVKKHYRLRTDTRNNRLCWSAFLEVPDA